MAGMWAAPPDPGVLRVDRYAADGKRLRFANVFAANDPESTVMNIEHLLDHGAIGRPAAHRDQLPAGPDRAQRPDGRADPPRCNRIACC